jgi:hypothetical protein
VNGVPPGGSWVWSVLPTPSEALKSQRFLFPTATYCLLARYDEECNILRSELLSAHRVSKGELDSRCNTAKALSG